MIKPMLAPDALVVGLQNGMTHEDIAAIIGRERTLGAVIEIASNMWIPGITNRQNDHEESWFALGALDPKTQPRVESVAKLLRNSGRVEVMEDIRSAEVHEVNGWVVDVMRAKGRKAPMNELVVKMGLEIEAGARLPEVSNAEELIGAYDAITKRR